MQVDFFHMPFLPCINIFTFHLAGERRLEAHRIVLSAASDYFAAMFTNDFGEANQNEIELQGVDPDALETLVCYCYTGNQTTSFFVLFFSLLDSFNSSRFYLS